MMSGAIKRRLLSLERSAEIERAARLERVEQLALQAVSHEDLNHLCEFFERGARLGSISMVECTPAEKAALERYAAEREAALRLASR